MNMSGSRRPLVEAILRFAASLVAACAKAVESAARRIASSALASVFAAVVLSVALTGCSGSSSEEGTQPEQPQAPPVEQQAEPEPEPVQASGELKVHFIDVGQGDSEFVEFPDGTTMLIDAGEADEACAVVGYVQSLGYSSIDYVVATHPHADHIGGMPAVLAAFSVGSVWAPAVQHDTTTFESFLDAVAAEGLQIDAASKGKSIHSADGLAVDVLSGGPAGDDLNDSSAIVKVAFGGTSFLFTGDAGAAAIASCGAGDVDVLKVGHHGSDTSTTPALVSSLAPEYAVISCGAGNSYGHPHDSTLSALAGSTVYRTDVDGTVKAVSDGANVTWETGLTTPRAAVSAPAPAPAPAPEPEAAPAPAPAPADQGASAAVVYITKSGEKYHLDGCSSLRKSKIETTLSDAKARGYEPCKKCNPPA